MPSQNIPIPDDDRPRGVLSEADREYLRGKKEYSSEQSERDARFRIRARIRNAIMDFSIIYRYLGKRDRDQIFDSFEREYSTFKEFSESADRESFRQIVEDAMVVSGVSDALGFFYQGTKDKPSSFEDLLESSIRDIESERGYVVENVNVEIEIQRKEPDFEELKNRLEEGSGLTEAELSTLLQSGKIELTPEKLDMLFSELTEDAFDDRDEGG